MAATDRLELLCRQSDAIQMKRSVCHAITVLLIVQCSYVQPKWLTKPKIMSPS